MSKAITLNHITKIEGHAKLELGIENNQVTKCELSTTEGARYFEGIVKGRRYNEAHEITSRICGICSCAHVIAAITAVENAMGYEPTEQAKKLRLLITYGERIRSHATHIYFLALPDYLGYESALAMAKKYRKQLQWALNLMKAGNGIIKNIGGRDLHPVSATVGGWLKIPTLQALKEIKTQLEAAKEDAEKTCRLFFSLQYPEFKSGCEYFSLVDGKSYATLDGKFTSQNTSFEKWQYRDFVNEYHEPRSTANFVVKGDHRYMVGALPRLNNNSKMLSNEASKMLKKSKMKLPSTNPFNNVMSQAIEIVHFIDESVRIIDSLSLKNEKPDKLRMNPGNGVSAVEVP